MSNLFLCLKHLLNLSQSRIADKEGKGLTLAEDSGFCDDDGDSGFSTGEAPAGNRHGTATATVKYTHGRTHARARVPGHSSERTVIRGSLKVRCISRESTRGAKRVASSKSITIVTLQTGLSNILVLH